MLFSKSIVSLAVLASTVAALPAQESSTAASTFHPEHYRKKFVTCNAVERSGAEPKAIKLKLAYLDINPKASKTLVMLHGWPSLWTTYRNQIQAFGDEYRLIIPEHRGFGDSQHPADLFSSNTMPDFVEDVQCVMDDAGVKAGVCVGNDFGAQLCWEAGRMRPDRFIGVFNVGVPYVSASLGYLSNEALVHLVPTLGYTLYLSRNASGAAQELNADPRMAIRSCAQTADSVVPSNFLSEQKTFLGPWKDLLAEKNLKEIPLSGIMSQEVEDYMVKSYKKQGFYNTFNGYQDGNRNGTFQFEIAQGNFTLSQPTFNLYPSRDPVAQWIELAAELHSSSFLTNHFNATIPTSHWSHEESPEAFNQFLREWIGNVTFPEASPPVKHGRASIRQ